MLLSIVYVNHPNQTKRSVPKCRRIYVLPPPPPKNRDKSKNLRSVKTALRASTLAALGLLIALAVLLPNAAAEAQTSPASTATATATATPTDYDTDNDGLIDINTLAQLNAVRHDLDGDGKQGSVSATDWATYTSAFPNPASGMGCKPTDHDDDTTTAQQPTCDGYELMADLDFDTDGDGDVDSSDTNSYSNWTPIGTSTNKFDSVFEGSLTNGVMPKISNLTISSASTEVGLFGATSDDARIKNVGLVDVNLRVSSSSSVNIGALVGNNAGEVIACYSTGAIDATAGEGSYAGGLVGYNRGTPTDPATIAASFSRATVSMSIHSTATTRMDIIAGGLVGHNSNGTLTATYAAGAVRGKGGGGSYVGGLVGDNAGTITASYSIAPVTAAGMTPTATASNKPGFGGLIGYNDSSATVTASYWDFISSGIDDASPNTMPQGKSTHDLISPTGAPTSATGTYAGWDKLTINDAVDQAPWGFAAARFHPLLTYSGHTTAISGNQLFVNGGISGERDTIHPHEGMTLYSDMGSYGGAFNKSRGAWRSGSWIWETSTDGITWSHLDLNCAVTHAYSCGAAYPAYRGAGRTFHFVPRAEHENKYIRAKAPFTRGGYIYTRVIGKIKVAGAGITVALGFTSGDDAPLVGTAITASTASLPSGVNKSKAAALWYRCDANSANPPSTGCELVGSRVSYIPGASDLGHYLHAYIYYKQSNAWVRASTGFTKKVEEDIRRGQWR